MTHRISAAAALLILLTGISAAMSIAADAEVELKSISADGITVRYPANMEAQAHKVLDMAVKQIQPSVEVHKQIIALLADPAGIASSITSLLGADEAQEKTRARLVAYKQKSEALVASFSTIKLMETASAVATGGVDAGVIQVRYDKDANDFRVGTDLNSVSADTLKRSYFPVFVNADGKIRAEERMPEMAIDFLGSAKVMVVAPIHETVAWVVTQQLNFYHPLARWFSEGVSGWVTRRVITRLDPKLQGMVDQMFLPGAAAKKYREKVNLMAWPQISFQNSRDPGLDPALEVAQTQYSVELITSILGSNRGNLLARIVGELKYAPVADTNAICEAIKKTCGTDAQKMLQTYVPKEIRDAARLGEAKKLVAQAEKLVQNRKWSDAAAKLRRAALIEPSDVNTRLNLAWVERELGQNQDSELQVFLAAGLLGQQKYSFHLLAPSVEGNYVLGRLAILLGNLEYARKFLEPVLQAKPDHKDAKRAMAEIKALETAATRTRP